MLKRLLAQKRPFKFMVVGGSGVFLSLSLMYLFTTILGWFYMLSYLLTFVIVVGYNYSINSRWTFKGEKSRGVLMFYLSRVITLGTTEGLLYLLAGLAGLYYMLAYIIALAVSFTINYFMCERIVWQNA